MKQLPFIIALAVLPVAAQVARATDADDTTITITGNTAGVTPFISQVALNVSDTSTIKSIQFTVSPKPGSVTRPLSGNYNKSVLVERDYLQPPNTIFLPVYGLYDGYTNSVTLTYHFLDGSSKQANTTITTPVFSDPCGFKHPTVLQARTDSTQLSYDFFLIKDSCSVFAPTIMDTDGAIRWVGPPGNTPPFDTMILNNAIYRTDRKSSLYRIDLDGTVTFLHDYSDIGVTQFTHNIDLGKVGLICDVDTTDQIGAVNIEVDPAGNVVKIWNLAEIISNAMIAGGDDPSQFVASAPTDWFHNNATFYNRADDSVVISSRENFVICLDYETGSIKWIFGDPNKQWYQFPSLRRFALAPGPDTLPPVGQHAPSITFDQNLLVFDDGFQSSNHVPPGVNRLYASPRKYKLNLTTKIGTEVWNYEMGKSILDPICSSIYEDAPYNYLIDYAFVGGFNASANYAQLLGLDVNGDKIFYYQYPTTGCNTAFNSFPLHLENTSFPSVGPQTRNISTRGLVADGDHSLIAGFIVTGTESKRVVLRALGPSLAGAGLAGTLADPILTVHDSSGAVIATNDDWESDPGATEISADGLAPTNGAEAATVQSLAPGSYTVIATGKGDTSGIGLVEAYDISPETNSRLANISTRGFVGVGDDVLISGFIVGDVSSATVVVRALGPSLASKVSDPLSDPIMTIYDSNGSQIAVNNNWQQDVNESDVEKNGLAPSKTEESAIALRLPAGAYSAIVRGVDAQTGVSLLEVYDLD